MKPNDIKVGLSYKNKGKGRTTRTVLEISSGLECPWFSSRARPDEPVVRFRQGNREAGLYLRSFAAWAGSEGEQLTALPTCKWIEDSDGNWETSCVNIFVFIEGTPSGNDMKFCCYCGLPLEEIKYVEEYNDDEI